RSVTGWDRDGEGGWHGKWARFAGPRIRGLVIETRIRRPRSRGRGPSGDPARGRGAGDPSGGRFEFVGDLLEQVPGVEAGAVAVVPGELDGVVADGLHGLDPEIGADRVQVEDAFAGPFIAAGRA